MTVFFFPFQRRDVAIISQVHAMDSVPMFSLKSLDQSRKIRGRFYNAELRLLKPGDTRGILEIEKILDRKEKNGEPWVLVKYRGLIDPSFQRWVKESEAVISE